MNVLAKVPKKQRIVILGVGGAVALFVLYRWYAARSASATAQAGTADTSGLDAGTGGVAGSGGGGDGGVDLSGIQSSIDQLFGQVGTLPTFTDVQTAIMAGQQAPSGDTNSGGVAGGSTPGGGNSGGPSNTAHPASLVPAPPWLAAAAKKVGGKISTDVSGAGGIAKGATYLLTSPGSGGTWHTYYTAAGKIARQVFVKAASPTTTSHQGASVPGALQGNGAVAIVDHAVKTAAVAVAKPKAGYAFLQDSGTRKGLSYNIVKKAGKNFRRYENGEDIPQ